MAGNPRILALGSETKTAFSVLADGEIFTAKGASDLGNIDSFNAYERDAEAALDGGKADHIACDMHPDYRSTFLAEELAEKNGSAGPVRVQHHHAHIAACMMDNDLDEEVIGVSFDGTGYGLDGLSWGGEFLLATRGDFSREYHLKYVPAPGGDIAVSQTWRMALAYLYDAYGETFRDVAYSLMSGIDTGKIRFIGEMIKKNVNSPLTSSMGRLFDAVAALTGICTDPSFEAEGAIKLEKTAAKNIMEHYGYDIIGRQIDASRMIRKIAEDVLKKEDISVISAKVHNTVGEIIFDVSGIIGGDTGLRKVLISGGCFQNKYLVEYIEKKFDGSDMNLYKHKKYPVTDLNISIGQAVVAGVRVSKWQSVKGHQA